MKVRKIIFFILLIILIVLSIAYALIIIEGKHNSGGIFKPSVEHKNYKIVSLYGEKDKVIHEHYFIIDFTTRKIVEERKLVTGYKNEDENTLYNPTNSENIPIFNTELRGETLIYSTTMFKDQDVDAVIFDLKLYYDNVIVKEL